MSVHNYEYMYSDQLPIIEAVPTEPTEPFKLKPLPRVQKPLRETTASKPPRVLRPLPKEIGKRADS